MLGSHVVVVLFDVNKIHSFEKAEKILKAIEICGVKTKILVGSKTDMINTKKHSDPVLQVDAEKLAKAYGCEYYPCNSTLPESVNHIYNSIMSKISSLNDNPLDLNKLLEKNIVTGKRVYSHPDFIKSMKEASLFNN